MFSKTETIESQLVPGAKFTIHRVGIGKRLEIERKTVDLRYELFCIGSDYLALVPDPKELPTMSKQVQREAAKIDMLWDLKKKEIEQAWAQNVLISVTIDGEDVPISDFLQFGDDVLMLEVQQKINEHARLTTAEVPNSERPTISSEAVDGPIEITTADSAKSSDFTVSETA